MTARGAGDPKRGRVILVGAGPGDPDLITIRGATALSNADVVLYDELAIDELLALAPSRAELINVGKRGHDGPTRAQDEINALLIEYAAAGRTVVRLKGGDPFVFGRGGEEASAVVRAGFDYEVVPGVSSSVAALSYSGIPVTDRRHAASFAVVTGHKDPSKASEATRWSELGRAVDTLVILMGMRNLEDLVAKIMEGGKSPATPAAAIMNGTLATQKVVVAPLSELPASVRAAGLKAPAAVVIGDVVSLRDELAWWESVPLFGRRVLVTRAPHQAGELAQAIRSVGAEPVFFPMIELIVQCDPSVLSQIESALRRLHEYDALVFSSSNAVDFFAELAGRAGADLGALRAQVLCVGEKTARAALDAGMPVHVVASGRSDADGLLAEFKRVIKPQGLSVLIPRSNIGRTVIADGLRAAGAHVESLPFYVTGRPPIDREALSAQLKEGLLDVLTFTSPSTVDHFAEALDDEARSHVTNCMIAAVGKTTARAVEAHGWTPHIVPQKPDVRALVAAVAEFVGSQPSNT